MMLGIELNISTVVWLFIISATAGISAWCIFVWAIKDRQFEDIEDVSMRLNTLDDVTAVEAQPESKDRTKEEAKV